MYSITHISMVSYLVRVLKDIINRNPRFRRALGNVSLTTSNAIRFGDLQIIVKDITTDATRLSPDYYMTTTSGRAILAQVADKDGSFIEWIREVDASLKTPVAGVYYLHVNELNEKTQDVELAMLSYKWYEGRICNAQGTAIAFRPGIDATTVTVSDPLSPVKHYVLSIVDSATLADSVSPAPAIPTYPVPGNYTETLPLAESFSIFADLSNPEPQVEAHQNLIYLLSAIKQLKITDASGNTLVPNVDYWMQSRVSQVLTSSTTVGAQALSIPAQFRSLSLVDQEGYVLTPGGDYQFQPNFNPDGSFNGGSVQLSRWTPANSTISAVGTVYLDPTDPANLLNSENIFNFTVAPTESLVNDQVFVYTNTADCVPVTVGPGGVVTLPFPLPPGGWCRYEARVLVGQSCIKAQKNHVNLNVLPGLRVAIGDNVVLGDQCAIIVSPKYTETYEVYGSKPGMNFTLDIKANDPTTADEMAKMVLQELLVKRRVNLEVDGLTIYEASSSFSGAQRDDSGTAPTYKVTLSVAAAADWRVYKPLVTRVTGFHVHTKTYLSTDYPGKLNIRDRYWNPAATGFLPDNR